MYVEPWTVLGGEFGMRVSSKPGRMMSRLWHTTCKRPTRKSGAQHTTYNLAGVEQAGQDDVAPQA